MSSSEEACTYTLRASDHTPVQKPYSPRHDPTYIKGFKLVLDVYTLAMRYWAPTRPQAYSCSQEPLPPQVTGLGLRA